VNSSQTAYPLSVIWTTPILSRDRNKGMQKQTQKTDGQSRRNETGLDVCADVFSDKAIQGLVEDWIVPMIVEKIIEKVLQSQE